MNIDFFGGFHSPLPTSNFDIYKICYKIQNISSSHIKLSDFNIKNNYDTHIFIKKKYNLFTNYKNIVYLKDNIFRYKCLDTKCNQRYNKHIFHIPIHKFNNNFKFRCSLHSNITCSKFIKKNNNL